VETGNKEKSKDEIEQALRQGLKSWRFAEALFLYLESHAEKHRAVCSKRRSGNLMDDMGKLADANSSLATLSELKTGLEFLRESAIQEN